MGDFMDSNFDEWKTYWDSVIKKPYVDYRKLKKDKPKYKPNYKNKYWLYEKRNAILKELGYNSYSEYLNSELWKNIRSEILKTRWSCEICGDKSTVLHHKAYNKMTLIGKANFNILSLCNSCHFKVEFTDNKKLTLQQSNKKERKKSKDIKPTNKCHTCGDKNITLTNSIGSFCENCESRIAVFY